MTTTEAPPTTHAVPMPGTFGAVTRRNEIEPEFLEPTDLLGDLGFASAFPGPTPVIVAGQKYDLQPLSTDDYVPWLNEILSGIKQSRMASIPPTANAKERWQIATNIEETELTPDHFMAYIMYPKWGKAVCQKVLENAKVPDNIIVDFLKNRPVKANEMFACYFSGLFTVNQFNSMYLRTTAGKTREHQPPATFGRAGSNSGPFVPANTGSDLPGHSAEIMTGHSPDTESSKSPVNVPVK